MSNFGDLGKVTTTRPKVTLQALGAIGTKELEDLASILKEKSDANSEGVGWIRTNSIIVTVLVGLLRGVG